MMSLAQTLFTILIIAFVTFLTRAVPFMLFPAGRKTPEYVVFLGKVLPCATIGMLVVFCLKSVAPAVWPHGIPEALAVAAVALLQYWKGNSLVSIVTGTVLYMVLVQTLFA